MLRLQFLLLLVLLLMLLPLLLMLLLMLLPLLLMLLLMLLPLLLMLLLMLLPRLLPHLLAQRLQPTRAHPNSKTLRVFFTIGVTHADQIAYIFLKARMGKASTENGRCRHPGANYRV